jgi:CrcB protein
MLFVGIGGFLGANARYLLSTWLTPALSDRFNWHLPYGTAFVNVTGSLLLAVFMGWAGSRADLSESVKLLIGTGFFGAYTTFSTYSNESIRLITDDNWRTGLGYIVVTNVLCLVGVVAGLLLANRLFSSG